MKVVSFSTTRLAGAPMRNALAIAQHSSIETRHIDLKLNPTFPQDHVHEQDPDTTVALAESADIIHLYNYLDYDSTDFAPVDFRSLQRHGKQFIRQFESTPQRVADLMKVPLARVLECPIPKLVIPHYPERFLPTARVVPNILPDDDPAYALGNGELQWDVVYTPSWLCSAWAARWDTKGMPETVAMLDRLRDRTGCRTQCISKQPLAKVLEAKRQTRIVIDDLVTGSYHLSGLEGLCFGKPTLAFLDQRTLTVLHELSGSYECPFINVRLEDAEEALAALLRDPEALDEVGRASRNWFERHWTARRLVRHYVDAYEQLLDDPTQIGRQPSLRCDRPARRFFAVELPDCVHRARARAAERQAEQERRVAALEAKVERLYRQFLPEWIVKLGRRVTRAASGK